MENQEVIIVDNRGLPMMLDANIEVRVMHSRRLSPLSKVIYFQLLSIRYLRQEVPSLVDYLRKFNLTSAEAVNESLEELRSCKVVSEEYKPLEELTPEVIQFLKGAKK